MPSGSINSAVSAKERVTPSRQEVLTMWGHVGLDPQLPTHAELNHCPVVEPGIHGPLGFEILEEVANRGVVLAQILIHRTRPRLESS